MHFSTFALCVAAGIVSAASKVNKIFRIAVDLIYGAKLLFFI